jgi:hypothetical protein
MLSTVMLVLSQLWFNLKIRLKSKSTTIYLDINIGNEAIFCSNYFKNCRGIAWITATYLDQELANLKWKGGNNDWYTSKVETIKHKKGVTVETLENVATICGLEATFEYKQ